MALLAMGKLGAKDATRWNECIEVFGAVPRVVRALFDEKDNPERMEVWILYPFALVL